MSARKQRNKKQKTVTPSILEAVRNFAVAVRLTQAVSLLCLAFLCKQSGHCCSHGCESEVKVAKAELTREPLWQRWAVVLSTCDACEKQPGDLKK